MRPTVYLLSRRILSVDKIRSSQNLGKQVDVQGWVQTVRKLKNVAFAQVSDGSCARGISVVLDPVQAKNLTTGACVSVSGILQESPASSAEQFELLAENPGSLKILGASGSDYPLQKKFHTQEFLRTIPAFRWRTTTNSSVLRYKSFAQLQIAKYFDSQDFFAVNSPLITSSDCEGAGEVFNIVSGSEPQFFSRDKAYLTVSSQLHLEVFAGALSRVWNLTPAFRAEKSDTYRHLAEFWMVEAELAFTRDLDDIMQIAESMIRSAVPNDKYKQELLLSKRNDESKKEILKSRWNMILNNDNPWPRLTYTEAISKLRESQFPSLKWGDSLASEHEKYLAGTICNSPVFVTDYPAAQKPFYMKESAPEQQTSHGNTVACFDLLIPDVGELIGGSLRQDNYDLLVQSMQSHGMDPAELDWYLDLRKHGSFPHGGFGMGFERLICFMTNTENIRDTIGFPRWHGSCVC